MSLDHITHSISIPIPKRLLFHLYPWYPVNRMSSDLSHASAAIEVVPLTWPIPQLPQPRSSFSVERGPANHQSDLSASAQYRPDNGGNQSFQPYPMHQFPPPQPGRTPPSPAEGPAPRPQSQIMNQQPRVASNPQAPPGLASNDFGPYPSASQFPRSQTMGFPGEDRGARIPDTHPYRGFLNAQQDKNGSTPQQQGGAGPGLQQQLPRSGSMPLDKPQPPAPISNGNSGRGSPNASSTFSGTQESPADQHHRPMPPPQVSQPDSRRSSQSNMPPPQSVKQPPTPSSQPQSTQPSWQREFNNIVDLIGAQPNKHYAASPPELEMILARTSAGALPK